MNKNDFKLIHSFIDVRNPKFEINYALVSDDGIYATDSRKAIKYHIPLLGCDDILANKKVVKCIADSLGKDDSASINADGVVALNFFDKISLSNRDDDEFKYPDINKVLDVKLEYRFELSDIDDLHFELTQKECFIEDIHLYPIIEFGGCDRYIISYNKQKADKDTTHTGMVKIVGVYSTEDESDIVKFTAAVMGREFKTQAKEQLTFDMS